MDTNLVSRISYAGNGSTTVFAYPFRVFAAADLEVVVRSAAGVETVKTLTTHYAVSGVASLSGGNVTMVTAPANGETLVIRRVQPLVQELDLVANGDMPAESLEARLDRHVYMAQTQKEVGDRSIRFPVSDAPSISAELPTSAVRASKVLTFDASGNVALVPSSETLASISASVAAAAASASAASTSASNAATSAAQAAANALLLGSYIYDFNLDSAAEPSNDWNI